MHIQNLTILIKIIYIKRLKYILIKEKMIFFVIYYKNGKISLILFKISQFLFIFSTRPQYFFFSFLSHSHVPCLALFSLVFILFFIFYKLLSLVLSINKSQYCHIQNFILTVNSK